MFPDRTLKLLSNEGSSAVILEDGEYVFKVMRDPIYYSYAEDEMGALTYMHGLGLAPRPILLADAAEHYREEMKGGHVKRHFADIDIQRIETNTPNPILVMEKLDAVPLQSVTEDIFSADRAVSEYHRILDTVLANRIVFGDVELVLDRTSDSMKFIDLGGLSKFSEKDRLVWGGAGSASGESSPASDGQGLEPAVCANSLLHQFIYAELLDVNKFRKLVQEKGEKGVDDYIARNWLRPIKRQLPLLTVTIDPADR